MAVSLSLCFSSSNHFSVRAFFVGSRIQRAAALPDVIQHALCRRSRLGHVQEQKSSFNRCASAMSWRALSTSDRVALTQSRIDGFVSISTRLSTASSGNWNVNQDFIALKPELYFRPTSSPRSSKRKSDNSAGVACAQNVEIFSSCSVRSGGVSRRPCEHLHRV